MKQHIIPILIKTVNQASEKIQLVYNYVSPIHYKRAQSHVVLEQTINEVVPIYKEAKDYIICQLRSTIQHEAAHRSQELNWQRSDPETRQAFEELVDPSKAEAEPERMEENCIPPDIISGQTENISIYDLFEKAKSQANIDVSWKNDVMAATLVEGVAGQYLMKNISPDDLHPVTQIGSGIYRHGNKLLIDVRKQIEPWIAKTTSLPANIQTSRDGAVTLDPDLAKLQENGKGAIPIVPSAGTIPAVPSI